MYSRLFLTSRNIQCFKVYTPNNIGLQSTNYTENMRIDFIVKIKMKFGVTTLNRVFVQLYGGNKFRCIMYTRIHQRNQIRKHKHEEKQPQKKFVLPLNVNRQKGLYENPIKIINQELNMSSASADRIDAVRIIVYTEIRVVHTILYR